MNDESKSRYDKFNWWLRNNPITATLIFVGALIIALSTLTDSAQNLLNLLSKEKRPDINGVWTAEVTYDWARATYTETFIFEGEGEEIVGTASFLKIKRLISEGKVNKDRILFITKTKEIGSSWDNDASHQTVRRYLGKIEGDRIQFTMQTEGGFVEHVPVEFTAQKVPEKEK